MGSAGPAGAQVAHAEPPEPAERADTVTFTRLDPRVRTLWWIVGAVQAAFVTLIAAGVDRFAPLLVRDAPLPWPSGLLTAGVGFVAVTLALVIPVVRYRRWGYALCERDLWIRQGVWWVTVSVIPYARLQFVDTRSGPLERAFGLTVLVVHTAALGTAGRLPGLDAQTAEGLRGQLAALESAVDAL